ncbi:CPBP family intramembrane metalloprotease [bacterium 1XD8-76]|nr:CPBP family intramembrane metalloprotease [bacterium 1XD8-76]
MNSRRIGVTFLLQMLCSFLLIFGITVYYMSNPAGRNLGIVENLIVSQSVNVLPLAFMLLIGRRKFRDEKVFRDILGFRRIKISTALMTVLYTFLLMPLTTLANAISMIFVDNTVANLSGDILNVPFVVMFTIMAVFGPFCEEVVFRGAFFRGFRKTGNIFGAIVISGILFALMHMNLNQAAYALLLGTMMALLAEAAGSTWAPFIVHFIFNGQSVCLLFLEDKLVPELMEEELESFGGSELMFAIAVYLLLAVVCTSIAFCVVTWIASNEGKQNFLRTIWASRKNRGGRLWSVCLAIGVALALVYIGIETAAQILM